MVRALASRQCGPGSIAGVDAICRLSLLLVLVPDPRVFLPAQSTKINISEFQFDLKIVDE